MRSSERGITTLRETAAAAAHLEDWARTQLPSWNTALSAGEQTVDVLVAELQPLLVALPSPLDVSIEECRRLLVCLGMVGSSIERHSQERHAVAGAALGRLEAGTTSFRRYVATLASRAGGPPRDSFLSYVMWNMPSVAVYVPGEHRAALVLPGVFGAERPITFTGTVAEEMFLTLLKRSAALEAIANSCLLPICDGKLHVDEPTAVALADRAALLLRSVRAEMRVFIGRPEFTPAFMLDVQRQYACPWDELDAYNAPSGAHDTAFIVRDHLLGMEIPGYDDHVVAQFDVLDAAGQHDILRARRTRSLATRLRACVGVDDLQDVDATEADELLTRHPWLVSYVRLYQANAALDATHWAMIMKYLINPMRERDHDAVVVSNHEGNTHMGMDTLRSYMEARTHHPLSGLKHAARSHGGLAMADVGDGARAVGPADPEATRTAADHPLVLAVHDMSACHNAGDLAGTRRFYTEDVVWHVQGTHRWSGDRVGIDRLLDYFSSNAATTGGTLRLHPQTVTISGDLIGVLMRVTARRPDGRTLDTLLAQTLRVAPDGRWCEYWAVADDQEAVDAFWS